MNSLRITRVFRSGSFNAMLAALALLLLVLVAPASADLDHDYRVPDLGECQKLQVQPGNMVAFRVLRKVVPIYRGNGMSWDFVAPEALLFADSGGHGLVGFHFAGPTWESLSGSNVVGEVLDHCTPDADAIPWLLLKAASHEGPGIFHRVTYLQRLNTVGDLAPTVPGNFPDQMVRVPYSADYVFYQKAH